MKRQVCLMLLLIACAAGLSHGRGLQQQFSSASAVSVSGGSGPNGNCGQTSTVGNAQAFASGPPCPGGPTVPAPPTIPAPPPSTTCPTTTQTVNWGTQSSYPVITVCPGSSVDFKWNTASASQVFGLYQIPSTTCPASATADGVKLLITPASSPNPAGFSTVSISVPGTYYFTDVPNCSKGQLQQIVISGTAPSAQAQAGASAAAGKKL